LKFLLDNNLPPALARALNQLTTSQDTTHTVEALKNKFPANTPDEIWIKQLADEGGWVIISHDKFRKAAEPEVLRRAGLIVFLLGKSWGNIRFWDKAYHLVRWWPAIMDQSERVSGGAAYEVPLRFSGKGKFKQLIF